MNLSVVSEYTYIEKSSLSFGDHFRHQQANG